MKIAIIGAGAWGTALAVHAASQARHSVRLWARETSQREAMHLQRLNTRYLPDIHLPPSLDCVQGDLFDAEAIATDLADRLVVDGGLDDLVGQGDPGAPVPFDAEDPR